jgi:hypothetical protein
MALELTSSAFAQGGEIPKRYTCDGVVSRKWWKFEEAA